MKVLSSSSTKSTSSSGGADSGASGNRACTASFDGSSSCAWRRYRSATCGLSTKRSARDMSCSIASPMRPASTKASLRRSCASTCEGSMDRIRLSCSITLLRRPYRAKTSHSVSSRVICASGDSSEMLPSGRGKATDLLVLEGSASSMCRRARRRPPRSRPPHRCGRSSARPPVQPRPPRPPRRCRALGLVEDDHVRVVGEQLDLGLVGIVLLEHRRDARVHHRTGRHAIGGDRLGPGFRSWGGGLHGRQRLAGVGVVRIELEDRERMRARSSVRPASW